MNEKHCPCPRRRRRETGGSMPTPGILVAAMAVGLLVIGVQKTAHGAKKVGHQIGCVVKTGHKCAPKPQPTAATPK